MESRNVKTLNFRDQILECIECRRNFTFTIGEQRYFDSKGLSTPKRCPQCRLRRRLTLVRDNGGAAMQISDFLLRLEGVKRNGNGYLVLCPSHDDHHQGLSVTFKSELILLHCHAGCKPEVIVERMGLTMGDLSPDGHKAEQRQIEAIYHYTDANGKPFEVVRTNPKGFYQRQPDGKGSYLNHLKGITPKLYHQDKLRQAIDSDTSIYIVEGEKDEDRPWSLGLVSTTNPMGAGKRPFSSQRYPDRQVSDPTAAGLKAGASDG